MTLGMGKVLTASCLILLYAPSAAADLFTVTDLGTLGGYSSSVAVGINNKGQIVGTVIGADGCSGNGLACQAFLYSGGGMIGLGTLGGNSGSASVATGINDKGQVVGYSNAIPGGPADAFLYNDGVMTGLGTLAGYDTSYATGINNKGQVVGYVAQTTASSETVSEAFLYDHGVMTDIGPPGWSNTTATAINAKGQIVGYGINPEGAEHAFLLTPDPAPDPASVFLLGTVVIGLGAFAFARKRLRQDLRGGVLPPRTGLTTARAAPASLLHIYTSIHPI